MAAGQPLTLRKRRSGGTVVGGCRRGGKPSRSSAVASPTLRTARSKASSVCPEGEVIPLTLRTYWRAAASISVSVALGSRPRKTVILRHMRATLYGYSGNGPTYRQSRPRVWTWQVSGTGWVTSGICGREKRSWPRNAPALFHAHIWRTSALGGRKPYAPAGKVQARPAGPGTARLPAKSRGPQSPTEGPSESTL